MSNVVMIGQFLLSLSILIVLHECGHFFTARWFGMRVEKFYLFFDPWFSLVKKKIGDTEYGIGWLPLGGYVKVSGMVDESMDLDHLKQAPQPYEFRAKPAWQRLINLLGGVVVNFILGFIIFIGLLWAYGEKYLPMENATNGIYADSLGTRMGLKTGDKILAVDGKKPEQFRSGFLQHEIVFNNAKSIQIERNGQKMDLPIAEGMSTELGKRTNQVLQLYTLPMPAIVDSVIKGKPSEKAGFKKGDKILAINADPVQFYNDLPKLLAAHKNESVAVKVLRGQDTTVLSPTLDADGKIGFKVIDEDAIYHFNTKDYSFLEAIPTGLKNGWDNLTLQVSALGKIVSGKLSAKENLGGFGSIAQQYGKVWNWYRFWFITGVLSMVLGFMNLLPIPALDGGYVVFTLWEMITGNKPSDKFIEKAVTIGFFLLLGLLLYVNGMDVIRGFSK